ncbi:MAG TPA: carboxypeptidase-like regulatory domain-containing protein [Pyrinomonadaceae bacterium]|nr:carboxypeptidase-like regulatory domain-containing protein [Pyrinomonadaceae bacterium]
MDENPNLFVSISDNGNAVITGWNLSWTSPANLDRLVSIVAVRGQGGTAMNVYSYPNLAVSDTGTFTAPGGAPITQVRFCFEPFSGPSSAPVAISGRALTAEGTGISGARISVVDLGSGETLSAVTNPFGYYTIEGLVAESTYMVSASHKRHSFVNNQRTITISEDLAGVDFVAP